MSKRPQKNLPDLAVLGIIWLLGLACDRLWFALDNSIPAWDQADYLNGAMNYWQALQTPQWFDPQWWQELWLLSSKIPPGFYMITVPFLNLFGTSLDAASLVLSLFSAILLLTVYGLGVQLFNRSVGFWAAGLCQLIPGLYRYRLEFLLDYPLTAVVTLSFCCLTIWKLRRERCKPAFYNWVWAILFGLSLGFALMIKQTALLFLLPPILWVLAGSVWRRQWGRLSQVLIGLSASLPIFYPWYRTNWLLILTAGKRATIDSAIAEGDPALTTFEAWIYYLKILPYLLSFPLLIMPIVGILLYWKRRQKTNFLDFHKSSYLRWLAVFLVGGYFLSSLNVNKDARYVLPLLPVFSLMLSQGLLAWRGRWQQQIRWGTLGLAVLLMGLNLFPLGGAKFAQLLSPRVQHPVQMESQIVHKQVIAEITQTSPYLQTTLGVLPSTPRINQHNFSFYGALANFQVFGRQVGVRENEIEADARSLDWFLTKTGEPGSVPTDQTLMTQRVEQGAEFQLQKTWQLLDGNTLKLYRRRELPVTVHPVSSPVRKVQLERVIIPQSVLPGVPVPVTFEWIGSWQALQKGLVLLTWKAADSAGFPDDPRRGWISDRALAMGRLHPGNRTLEALTGSFQVIEKTAMLPSPTVPPGDYILEATYLHRESGETYPISVPEIRITIDPNAPVPVAPELDLVTQLRTIAANLPQGEAALEAIFAEIARINQYDPRQDYLQHAEQTLAYRLQENSNRDWVYALALAQVLQKDVEGAIAAFQQVISLDTQNPYAYAYLAFIYLYDWQPKAAQTALQTAFALNKELPILHTLDGVAALMQGNLIRAWRELSPLLNSSSR